MKLKKLSALLLAFVLVLSLLPAGALAAGGTGTEVTVTVEISNPSNYNLKAGAPFEGAFDLNGDTAGTAAAVTLPAGKTAMDAIVSALTAAGLSAGSYQSGGFDVAYGGTYLDSVNGLSAGAASKSGLIKPTDANYNYDGWCGVVNDISPAVGFSSIYVSDGDVIRLEYSLDMSVSNTKGQGSANSGASGFTFSAGTLSSTGSAATYDLALTLTLPASASTVQVTATPCTKSPVVVYDAAGTAHALGTDIPVSNGDKLQIVGGKYEEVYTVAIDLIGRSDIDTLLKNIAAGYTGNAAQWNVIDLSAYRAYQPAAASTTSAAALQSLIDSAIAHAQAETPDEAAVSKDIVALQSAGIDPAVLYPHGSPVSLYDALNKTAHTSIYNVGYITLHAYRQAGKLTAAQASAMFGVIENYAKDGKYVYDPYGYGADIDTAAAILSTVAPFAADTADSYGVKSRAINIRDEIVTELAAQTQSASGSLGSSNTDASAIIGLIAAGIDPSTDERFKAASGASLLDGLLSYALTDLSGFGYQDNTTLNALATEQAFRALIAQAQMLKNSTVSGYAFDLYDFSAHALAPGYGSVWTGSPVAFKTVPADAAVSIEGQTPVVSGSYDLAAGDYTYTVSKDGYTAKTGSFTVSADDAAKHTVKNISVSLASAASGKSGGSAINVSFTLVGDTAHGENGTVHIYKKDGGSGRTWIEKDSLSLPAGSTAFDAFDKAVSAKGISYIEKSASYIFSLTNGSITLTDSTNGSNCGWMYLINGVTPLKALRDYTLSDGDSIVFYYTDDYTLEKGSEMWSGGSSDTSVSIPVREGASSTGVSAIISGKTATLSATAAQLSALKEQSAKGLFTLDLSAVGGSVTNAVVPAKLVSAMLGSEGGSGLSVALPNASVTLDATAFAAVSSAGKDLTFSLSTVASDKLSAAQKQSLGAQAGSALIFNVHVLAGEEAQSSFNGGSVTVSVSYTPREGEDTSTLTVWYLSDDGSITPTSGRYDEKTKTVAFTTPHLSSYVVVSFPFSDVATGSWYYGDVACCYTNALMTGTSAASFSPEETATRAALVTVLYRLSGSPAVTETEPFADVKPGDWYAKAVAWASQAGIVTGTDETHFSPDAALSREQAAALLYRCAKSLGLDTAQSGADTCTYADYAEISSYAREAMQWAVGTKLMQGSSNTLSPAASATRAQTAALLHRFLTISAK